MPSIQEQASSRCKAHLARSYDLASDHYDEANGDFCNPVGARLVDLVDPRPGDRVLDLGCGRGAVLFAAVAAIGPDGYAVGVDLSSGMVHRTAEQAARAGLRNVSVRVDDAEDLGFPAGSFEVALSSLALIFTPDPAAALASVHRVLVPRGRFGYTAFGADEDPAWHDVIPALHPFLEPGPEPEPAPRFNLLGDPGAAAGALAEAGFTGIRTVEETAVSEYPDAGAWWRSLWGSGRRAMLETIPPERREEARKAAFAVVEPLADARGRLVRRTAIRYTMARRI